MPRAAYQKKLREATEPIYKDISPALQAFARQRGVNVIFDVSKLAEVMFIVNETVDLTRAFIADYNQRNPVSRHTSQAITLAMFVSARCSAVSTSKTRSAF